MIHEDEDAKLRRNLLVVSTIVILIEWLGISAKQLAVKFSVDMQPGGDVDLRLWIAVSIALFYFALRFRFSEEHDKALEILRKDLEHTRAQQLLTWAKLSVAIFDRTGFGVFLLGEEFRTSVEELARMEKEDGVAGGRLTLVEAQYGHRDEIGGFEASNSSGTIRVAFIRRDDGLVLPFRGRTIDFRWGWLSEKLSYISAFVWVSIYSRSSTTLVVPAALASSATWVCTQRIFGAR